MRDLTRMELLVCSKLDWSLQESTPAEFLYSFFDILSNGRDFPTPHQRKAVSAFLASRLVEYVTKNYGKNVGILHYILALNWPDCQTWKLRLVAFLWYLVVGEWRGYGCC